jgi:hypothetical protein
MSTVAIRRAVAPWLFVAVPFLPRLAEACPMCASQQPGGGARIAALGVMMLIPFAIAFLLFRVLRSGGDAPPEDSSES